MSSSRWGGETTLWQRPETRRQLGPGQLGTCVSQKRFGFVCVSVLIPPLHFFKILRQSLIKLRRSRLELVVLLPHPPRQNHRRSSLEKEAMLCGTMTGETCGKSRQLFRWWVPVVSCSSQPTSCSLQGPGQAVTSRYTELEKRGNRACG